MCTYVVWNAEVGMGEGGGGVWKMRERGGGGVDAGCAPPALPIGREGKTIPSVPEERFCPVVIVRVRGGRIDDCLEP